MDLTTGFAENVTFGENTQTCSTAFKRILDIGGNDGKRSSETFPNCHVDILDLKYGYDIDKEGLPEGQWDILFAHHIIEHLFYPDKFLLECKRVMTQETKLIIGTPNLCAWFNRVLFLFGYVPRSMELSSVFNVGKAFDWGKDELGGHLRIYTPNALKDLLVKHGFNNIKIEANHSTAKCNILIKWLDIILTKLNKNLASAFTVSCTL